MCGILRGEVPWFGVSVWDLLAGHPTGSPDAFATQNMETRAGAGIMLLGKAGMLSWGFGAGEGAGTCVAVLHGRGMCCSS